jgi:hypothetical protein
MAGTNVADVVTFSNSVVVASNRLPVAAGTELATFPASASIIQAGVSEGGNRIFVIIACPDLVTISHEVRLLTPPAVLAALPRLSSLTLATEGFEQLTLRQPEILILASEPEWEPAITISGDALARVENGQLTLSALDPVGTNAMGFAVRFSQWWSSNEFRAKIQIPFGLFSPVPSNASVRVACLIDPIDGQHDDIAMQFAYTGPAWALTTTRSNAPLPMRHVAYWSSNEYRTVVGSGPVSITVSEPPPGYWPATTWFVDDDICHRFLWDGPVTVRINGVAYETTELRFLTDGPGGARPFQGLRVQTTGAEALVLSSLESRPVPSCLEPPAGLVNWWPFEQRLPNTVTPDIVPTFSPNKDHGLTSATLQPGKVGLALYFDGAQRMAVAGSTANSEMNFFGDCVNGSTAESFTIDCWIKTTQSGLVPLLDKLGALPPNPNTRGYALRLSSGQLEAVLEDGNPATPSQFATTTLSPLNDGDWHFIAVTYERCANDLKLYVDGHFGPVAAFNTRPLGSLVNSISLYVGQRRAAPDLYYTGSIDELHFFKRALRDTEIHSIWSAGSAGLCWPGANVPPYQLATRASGGQLMFLWSGSAVLQAADGVTGPWTAVAGATSGHIVEMNGPRKFYRLTYP